MEGAAAEAGEHSGAGVDGQSVAGGIAEKELGEEAAVPIAEGEGVVRIFEFAEECGAGALEQRTEGEVFGGAVDGGYAVEVGLRWFWWGGHDELPTASVRSGWWIELTMRVRFQDLSGWVCVYLEARRQFVCCWAYPRCLAREPQAAAEDRLGRWPLAGALQPMLLRRWC